MAKLFQRPLKYIGLGGMVALTVVAAMIMGHLWQAQYRDNDAYLVLGGSIQREMYMAELARTWSQPQPILVSAGSMAPCIRLLFEQTGADLEQIWLENCASSTFSNFVYSVPILEGLGARHVTLVTSGSHTFRAVTMARILLGVQGIWVEPLIINETGIPGNQETALKTTLDVSRSLLWSLVALVYKPTCDRIVPLTAVDLEQWRQRGFKCEHQAGIEGS